MPFTSRSRQKAPVQNREPFKYLDLQSKDHLRVLRVDQDKAFGDQLHCTLTQIDRHHDSSKWTAISYRWNPIEDLVSIGLREVINSVPHSESVHYEKQIPRKLAHMIRQLRRHHLGPNEYFWIDFLCLNQQNSTEKGEQVGTMSEIYSLSTRTLAWMGDADKAVRSAFKDWSLRFSIHPPRTLKEKLRQIGLIRRVASEMKKSMILSMNVETSEHSAIDGIFDTFGGVLLKADWFRRVWILQEAVLCPDLYFVWSDLIMSSECLCAFPKKVQQFGFDSFPPSMLHPIPGMKTLSVIADLRSRRETPDRGCDLATAIWATAGQDVTDPRDYIYGILGLITSTLTMPIDPDYTSKSSVQALYVDITSRWTQETQNFGLVYGAGRCTTLGLHGLPTWVPDYATLTPALHHVNETHAAGMKHVRSKIEVFCVGESLKLQAWVIDTVLAVLTMPDRFPFTWRDRESFPQAILAVVMLLIVRYCPLPWSEERIVEFCEAFWGMHEESPTEIAQGMDHHTLLALLPKNLRRSDEPRVRATWQDSFSFNMKLTEHILCFSLAVTTHGWFASVPHPLQALNARDDYRGSSDPTNEFVREIAHCEKYAPHTGDVIAVPLGSHLPFLLRPCDPEAVCGSTDKRYELLGTCYLPALDDGSFVERMDIELETIVIV